MKYSLKEDEILLVGALMIGFPHMSNEQSLFHALVFAYELFYTCNIDKQKDVDDWFPSHVICRKTWRMQVMRVCSSM